MRHYWLNHQGNRDCILFMAGWGMAPEPFLAIPARDVDILMVYDYRSLDDNGLADTIVENREGKRWHLLAWSMGVWIAAGMFSGRERCFSSSTAVAGTCRPVDDKYGIPDRTFIDTIRTFSPRVLKEFYGAMFDSSQDKEQFFRQLPQRPHAELKQELISLYDACQQQPIMEDIFQNHLVTGRDRIFPARNQLRAWGRQNCPVIPLAHFPFYQWQSWDYLLTQV